MCHTLVNPVTTGPGAVKVERNQKNPNSVELSLPDVLSFRFYICSKCSFGSMFVLVDALLATKKHARSRCAFGHLWRLEKVLDYLQIDMVCVHRLRPRTCLISLFVRLCLSSVGKVTSKLNEANAAWKYLISLVLLNPSLKAPRKSRACTQLSLKYICYCTSMDRGLFCCTGLQRLAVLPHDFVAPELQKGASERLQMGFRVLGAGRYGTA